VVSALLDGREEQHPYRVRSVLIITFKGSPLKQMHRISDRMAETYTGHVGPLLINYNCIVVDYTIVQQEDKAKVRNVKVIPSEECVPKHKLLVIDM